MERYDTAVPLASGGTAEVFEAWDQELGRKVALKFLRSQDPLLVERLLREARAQARVDHPHVCPIHEVGERDGQPFIAMHFVDGQTLGEAAADLTLEQRALLLCQVAEAVHGAHQVGLVHRDLKPSNVMVEALGDGELHAWVVDFGLALDEQAGDLTLTGQVLGTAAYMAPEQVRGDQRAVDRRTDVWGLGATLYSIIVGEPPFGRESTSEVLARILRDEPERPRLRLPSLPIELEAIVLKCLEKEPQRRYGSARDVAAELRRYLAGEPVEARPVTWWHRRLRQARRYPRLLAAAAALATVTLLAAGWAVATQLRSDHRASIAERFGRQAQDLEWYLRVNSMRPVHDRSQDVAEVRRRMEAVRSEMETLGTIARGPGQYALGRGHLALGELDEALARLDQAHRSGFRSPGLAWARGLALGQAYRRELQRLQGVLDEDTRASRRALAERSLRDPALQALAQADGGSSAPRAFVEAWIAYQEDRLEDAVASARQAAVDEPWFFEAMVLEGQIRMQIAIGLWVGGEVGAALEELERAKAAHSRAAELAPSEPTAWLGTCEVGSFVAHIGVHAPIGDFDSRTAAAEEACAVARRIQPDHPQGARLLAEIERSRVYHLAERGEDPGAALERALALAKEAVERSDRSSESLMTLGFAFIEAADVERRLGRDPRPSLAHAFETLDEVASLDADAPTQLIAVALSMQSSWELVHGFDPNHSIERARRFFERWSGERPERHLGAWNAAALLQRQAVYMNRHGGDPRGVVAEGLAMLDADTDGQDRVALAAGTRSRLHLEAARFLWREGRDPDPAVQAGLRAAHAARELWPDYGLASVGLCALHEIVARSSEQRAASEIAWQRAREWCERSLTVDPNHLQTLQQLASLESWTVGRPGVSEADRNAALRAGLAFIDRVIEADPERLQARVVEARLAIRGRHLVAASERLTARAASALRWVLERDPLHVEAQALRRLL